jgi:hypothetical protein
VRQQAHADREWPHAQLVAVGESVHIVGVPPLGEHAVVECQDGVQRTGQRMQRQRRRGLVPQGAGSQQRVQVGAVVGVLVADEHGVDLGGIEALEQSRQGRVPGVDQQHEAVVLEQVATARLPRRRPRPASAERRKSHCATIRPLGFPKVALEPWRRRQRQAAHRGSATPPMLT